MKRWIDLTCVVCGFRYSTRRIIRNALYPIRYPAQIVTSGGRARGFRVLKYVPWADIAKLKEDPDIWRALNCEYIRLASAYDEIIDALNSEIFRL